MSRTVSKTRTVDEIIRAKYREFATPVDRILADANLVEAFAAMVNVKLPADEHVEVKWLNWRLMTLRKRGEGKGGLPRLERAYYGRETEPQRKPKPR